MSSSTGSGLPSGDVKVLVTWDDLNDASDGASSGCRAGEAVTGRSLWYPAPVRVNVRRLHSEYLVSARR